MRIILPLQIVAVLLCLLATGPVGRADLVWLGNMPAGKILFLGNSITACPQTETSLWGLSASTVEKDYAHLLVGKINARTGGDLTMLPTVMPLTNPDGSVAQGGSNVVNIADVFERGYASYNASKLATQLAWKANIVVLQFGENIPNTTQNPFDATTFENRLRSLLNDLRQNSNPEIFVTSYIMGRARRRGRYQTQSVRGGSNPPNIRRPERRASGSGEHRRTRPSQRQGDGRHRRQDV